MSRVLIISDTHFGHKNICRFRPEFSSPEVHDNTVATNILLCLGKRDTLWLLGDCFFTEESVKYLEQFVEKCENVNFVVGNHDTDKKERLTVFKDCIKKGYFNKVGSLFKISEFWLTHHPIHPNELRGRKNIHGHVHTETIEDPNYLNVCCENINYLPVDLNHLKNESTRKLMLKDYNSRKYVRNFEGNRND